MSNIPDLPTCAIGDFNEDMLQENEKPMLKTFLAAGFTQHFKKVSSDSGTFLDHAYTKYIRGIMSSVTDCYYPNYDMIYGSIQVV